MSLAPPPQSVRSQVRRIGLVGNPNTGKTSLFNQLTGLRQRVANYPGITVDKKTGRYIYQGEEVEIVDLPGTYSLAAASPDERVVAQAIRQKLSGQEPLEAIVCVVDAGNLLRNLFLAAQIAELEIPLVIALNLWDEAEKKGLSIDHELLSRRLGVAVIPTIGKRGEGIAELRQAIHQAATCGPRMARYGWPQSVQTAIAELRDYPHEADFSDAEWRRLLFDRESELWREAGWSESEYKGRLEAARKHLKQAGLNPLASEALLLYKHLGQLLEGVLQTPATQYKSRSDSIDNLLLHRVWGVVIFVGMMYVVFQSVYTWAGPLMDLIESVIGVAQGLAADGLQGMPLLQSLIVDGVIAGVGAFIIFLPQILVLFFFISLLEYTGYMSRAAFLMDKLFSWCGLNGKSFVPLLTSYACAVPGIMAARTIADRKSRILTILIAPLMSCSARLPVYVLLIGAFIEPAYGPFWAGTTLFLLHFVGLLVAIPVSWFFSRTLLKADTQSFILEMPPYRIPPMRDVLRRMWDNGMEFVRTAGTVIFAMTILIWALLYFPHPESIEAEARDKAALQLAEQQAITYTEALEILADAETPQASALQNRIAAEYMNQSYLARFGKAVQPVFDPAGFDWRITVGIVASFPAREVIISTMGIIHSLGTDVDEESESLRDIMARETWEADTPRAGQPVYSIPVVLALMVFFALCLQCGSTLAVIYREIGITWAVWAFVYMTVLAWLGAVLTYQVGSLL